MTKIIGNAIPNMPWEDRPAGNNEVFWRYSNNPIIGWNPTPSTSRIFNSAVIPYGEGFVGIFRCDNKAVHMNLHFGKSSDGINWDIEDDPIQWVDEEGKPFQPGYAYDPRLVKIDDEYFIMWCTSHVGQATIGLGKTKDFKSFIRLENAFLPYNRNGVLFPRKIDGNYVLMSRPSDNGHTPFGDMYLSESPDMKYWGKHRNIMRVAGGWQSLKIGAGPIPIETSEGWLVIYHGVMLTCNGFVYSVGSAILDLECPSKVLYRCRNYLMTPETQYELAGAVPGVCFPCATLVDAKTGRLAMYYGAADTFTAVAFSTVDDVIAYTKKHNYLGVGDGDVGRN